jgi:hypothetical protein
MVNSETQAAIPPATSQVTEAPAVERTERVYPMSRQGRRQAIILLLGVASIWIFALWSLITILQDGVGGVEWVSAALMLGMLVVAPVVAWTLLEEANSRIVTSGSGIEYRTFGGIALAYGWDELEGFKPAGGRGRIAKFFLGDEEVDITSSNKVSNAEAGEPRPEEDPTEEDKKGYAAGADGRERAIPAAAIEVAASESDSEDTDEPGTLLLRVRNERTGQIANPLARFLHRQAHGASLPIYGGLEDRLELLDEIAQHLPVAVPAPLNSSPDSQAEIA